jgi:2-C-methyl-D-erythritol 4-phosphate cytidylyltransferase
MSRPAAAAVRTGSGEAWWGLVPAAGVGRRVGSPIPKQYLELRGERIIDLTLSALLDHPNLQGVVVALDPDDHHWAGTRAATDARVRAVTGGPERCHSVLNALKDLALRAAEDDWVLVHDAARPCLRRADLDRLIKSLADEPVGSILAIPVRDTMKQAGPSESIQATIPRAGLWHAYTPQAFRLGLLRRALETALAAGQLVTDDASAVELLGLQPRLIEGHADNIKITRPEDLPLAEFFLQQQGRLC